MPHLTNFLGLVLLTTAYVQFFHSQPPDASAPPPAPAPALAVLKASPTAAMTTEPCGELPPDELSIAER